MEPQGCRSCATAGCKKASCSHFSWHHSDTCTPGLGNRTSAGPEGAAITTLISHPHLSGVLFAGTAPHGLFKSTSPVDVCGLLLPSAGGAIHVRRHRPPDTHHSVCVAGRGPSLGGKLCCVFKSVDGGANWSPATAGLDGNVQALAIDPQMPTTLYAGASYCSGVRDSIFKTTDGGASWTLRTTVGASVNALVINPQTPGTIYAATIGRGVL